MKKIVFSNTLKDAGWRNAIITNNILTDEVAILKRQFQNDILIGSRSLIIQLLNSNLIDGFQLCIQPIIEGKALQLFHQIHMSIKLKLLNTKVFDSGAIILYNSPL